MSYFQDRLKKVGERMNEKNGETVSITRGGSTTNDVTASPVIKREAEEFIPGLSATHIEFQTWGINVADYKIGGTEVIPEVGDLITRTNGEICRVSAFDEEQPPYVHLTSNRDRYLVHTEIVGG